MLGDGTAMNASSKDTRVAGDAAKKEIANFLC
jgi:hypothetical protein